MIKINSLDQLAILIKLYNQSVLIKQKLINVRPTKFLTFSTWRIIIFSFKKSFHKTTLRLITMWLQNIVYYGQFNFLWCIESFNDSSLLRSRCHCLHWNGYLINMTVWYGKWHPLYDQWCQYNSDPTLWFLTKPLMLSKPESPLSPTRRYVISQIISKSSQMYNKI